MNLEHLTNRSPFPVPSSPSLAAGETIENVQICPVGDFPKGGRDQHCTLEALENVVKRWKEDGEKEVLVDFEHNSEAGGTSDTSAAAWVSNLRADKERGLVGDFKLTDLGAEAISNRRLRFLSVAWLVNKETREPMIIRSIALTNKPNIPVAPVLNRERREEGTVRGNREDSSQFPVPNSLNAGGINVEEKKGPTMDKIKEALGLSADATEEDILAAVKEALQAKEEVAELKANAEKAKLEAEAEEFAEKNKAKCDKTILKAQYIANKEVAQALVAGIPEVKAPTQKILNRGTSTPELKLNKEDARAQMAALPAEKRAEFYKNHKAEIDG
jgi:phage I-like protein